MWWVRWIVSMLVFVAAAQSEPIPPVNEDSTPRSQRTQSTKKQQRELPPDWREQFAADQDQIPPRIDRVIPHPGAWVVDNDGLSQVQIGFNEAVTIPAGAIRAWTVVGGDVASVGTAYDGVTNTLTITFPAAVRDDRLTLLVDFTVVDLVGNELDGEVSNPSNPSFPTGDGLRGGQAVFRFNILEGDANRDAAVNLTDATIIRDSLGRCEGDGEFNSLADLNVDGCVNALDAAIYRLGEGRTLPATDGAGPVVTEVREPTPNVLADFDTIWVFFSEIIPPDRFMFRSCYVVDQNGDVRVPTFISPSGFGDSADCVFIPPLPQCGRYTIHVSNGLTDLSGELLVLPSVPVVVSGLVPPPAPTLNAHTTSTKNPTVTITGTAMAATSVEVSGPMGVFTVPVTNNSFTVDFQPPQELLNDRVNSIFFTGLSRCDGIRSAPTRTAITRDNQSPTLFIDFPIDGASITTAGTDVAGRVGDVLSGYQGLGVTVNGTPATVNEGIGTNGTFFAANVPLNPNQPNVIQVTATDQLGNFIIRQITVTQAPVPPNTRRMEIPTVGGGNGQSWYIHTVLPQPIVVQAFQENGTTPLAGKWLKFEVTRSNGRLSGAAGYTCMGDDAAIVQCQTDAAGKVAVDWTLGDDAGKGNNRVRVTATETAGTVEFCATADAGPIKQVNIGMGNNQIVEVGAPAPEPLLAWVNDACNGNCPVQVTFTVTEGGGIVRGNTSPLPCDADDKSVLPSYFTGQSVTVFTSRTGHAEVRFTAGPNQGNNRITASVVGQSLPPATFIVYGVKRDPAKPTSFSGLVVDNGMQPIQGATCTLTIPCVDQPNNLWQKTVLSDLNGQFHFNNETVVGGIPQQCSGSAGLTVDGFPATHIGGFPGVDVPLQSYPQLHYEMVVIPNAENSLATPVRLPKMDECNRAYYSRGIDTILTIRRRCDPTVIDPNHPNHCPNSPNDCLPAIDGLRFIVKAGSMTIFGQPAPEGSLLMLNQVHHDDIPMPLPDGAAPPMTGTLWPPYAKFDPPIAVEFPNMVGLPPGAIAYFLSFDHDTSRFEIVASGHVTADGSLIVTDPGVGIPHGGWHGNCPPYSVTGDCDRCEGENDCCNDRCCKEPPVCCEDPDPCCDIDDPCCGNPNRCCNSDNPCCGSPDPCCNTSDPCCGVSNRCCNSDNPCCGSSDPCCNSNDPCCGNPDRCCNSDNPCCESPNRCCNMNDDCCGDPDPCCNPDNPCCPAKESALDNSTGMVSRGEEDPCCDNLDPCCNNDNRCCNVDCDDDNPCTIDTCVDGSCKHTCTGDCSASCGKNQVCYDCGCAPGNCSFNVIEEDGCPGGKVDMQLLGSCSPDCGAMTFSMVKSVQYIDVTLPGSIACDGTTHQRTVTVRIDEDAPPGPVSFRIVGTSPLAECDYTVNFVIVECVDLTFQGLLDPNKETDPGGFLCVNDDDDNNNGKPDKDEVDALTGQPLPVAGETDLKSLTLTLAPDWGTTGMVTLRCSTGCNRVRFYENSDRSGPLPQSFQLSIPRPNPLKTLYVEGIEPSAAPRDVVIEAEFDGPGGPCKDVVKLTVVQVDLDADSDNNNAMVDFGPQRDQAEDDIEDKDDLPGRTMWVNNNDDDRDNVADFGDGYNLNAANPNDDANADEKSFVRLVCEISAAVDLAQAQIRVTYDASEPASASITNVPPNIALAAGNLRIWTKNRNHARNSSVIPTGDYVAPGTYDASALGLTGTARTVNLWLEGIRPSSMRGDQRIQLELDPDGSGPADFCGDALRVTVSQLEILAWDPSTTSMTVADHVDIGHWGEDRATNELTGYTAGTSGTVINAAGGTFIDVDPDRFMVRLTHLPGNTNAALSESIVMQIGTLTDTGAGDDADHNFTLLETGPNSGVFESETQLLTIASLSNATPTQQDDGFEAYSFRTGATVIDEGLDDRTHKTNISGYSGVFYQAQAGPIDLYLPVCDREPNVTRVLHIHVRVFNEPFEDCGFDLDCNVADPQQGNGTWDHLDVGADGNPGTNDAGEGDGLYTVGEPAEAYHEILIDGIRGGTTTMAFVQEELLHASFGWASSCLSIVLDGTIEFVEAPGNVLGDNDFYDGGANSSEETTVLTAYNSLAGPAVLEVIFTPLQPSMQTVAYATIGQRTNINLADNYFVFVGVHADTTNPTRYTLAHELGHVLTNTFDGSYGSPNSAYVFYPTSHPQYSIVDVDHFRRVAQITESFARTTRSARFPIAGPPNPPPPTNTTGNVILQSP